MNNPDGSGPLRRKPAAVYSLKPFRRFQRNAKRKKHRIIQAYFYRSPRFKRDGNGPFYN